MNIAQAPAGPSREAAAASGTLCVGLVAFALGETPPPGKKHR